MTKFKFNVGDIVTVRPDSTDIMGESKYFPDPVEEYLDKEYEIYHVEEPSSFKFITYYLKKDIRDTFLSDVYFVEEWLELVKISKLISGEQELEI